MHASAWSLNRYLDVECQKIGWNRPWDLKLLLGCTLQSIWDGCILYLVMQIFVNLEKPNINEEKSAGVVRRTLMSSWPHHKPYSVTERDNNAFSLCMHSLTKLQCDKRVTLKMQVRHRAVWHSSAIHHNKFLSAAVLSSKHGTWDKEVVGTKKNTKSHRVVRASLTAVTASAVLISYT